MATRYLVLGQAAPAATTDTTLYTVPAEKDAIISTLVVANRGGSSAAFRISVRPAGATLADLHYIAFDVVVLAGDSITLTLGIALSATDVVTVRAESADLGFSAFGSEIDI